MANAPLVIPDEKTTVTVAPGRTLTLSVQGYAIQYVAGDQVEVPTNEVAQLRREGVIL